MFTSAELIEALRRRERRSLRPLPPAGEYPPGWQAWFAGLRERLGTISGATAAAIIAVMAQREPRPVPGRLPALSDWQAFTTLWRQQWHPASSDEHWQRVAAMSVSLLAQLCFAIFLLWLAYARYGGEPEPRYGDEVVQVEFIGQGTPEEQGGGAASGPEPQPRAAAAPRPQASAPAAPPAQSRAGAGPISEVAPAAARVAATVERPALRRPQPPRPSAQPVQVTETPAPEQSAFVLPPPTPRVVEIPRPRVEVPELAQQVQSIEAIERPAATVARRSVNVPAATVDVPELQSGVAALPSPPTRLALPDAPVRSAALPEASIRVPGMAAEPGSLPLPAGAGSDGRSIADGSDTGSAGAGTSTGSEHAATGAGTEGSAPASGGDSVAGAGGGQAEGTNAGAGPDSAAPPGAWASTRQGDDWGVSDRNLPGGQAGSGLFDEFGRPRLPPGVQPEAGGGLPPGTVTADIDDLDREGTWLKRPPIGYDPTRFDRYWLPGGTLLEQWVRRGIKEVSIAIPGTGKSIHCVVSLLSLGGACGVDDPDMQDQEAEARPPPDIPWKPELQDNQDAL